MFWWCLDSTKCYLILVMLSTKCLWLWWILVMLWALLCAVFVQVFIFEMPMFRREVDSFPSRRISGTPRHRKLAKVMPNFFVNFILSNFILSSIVDIKKLSIYIAQTLPQLVPSITRPRCPFTFVFLYNFWILAVRHSFWVRFRSNNDAWINDAHLLMH